MAKNIILLLIFAYIACGQATINSEKENVSNVSNQTVVAQNNENCVTMKFHYLVTENSMYSPTVRNIKIFLDGSAFSEDNLKTLFKYLSDKNSEAKILVIVVNTNWAQIPFASDCPPIGVTNQPIKSDEYDYHQATYYRSEKVEYFRYNPILKTSDFKTVVLKGSK